MTFVKDIVQLALTWPVLMTEGSALVYPTADVGRTNWPCHQHTRCSLRGRAGEVNGLRGAS